MEAKFAACHRDWFAPQPQQPGGCGSSTGRVNRIESDRRSPGRIRFRDRNCLTLQHTLQHRQAPALVYPSTSDTMSPRPFPRTNHRLSSIYSLASLVPYLDHCSGILETSDLLYVLYVSIANVLFLIVQTMRNSRFRSSLACDNDHWSQVLISQHSTHRRNHESKRDLLACAHHRTCDRNIRYIEIATS